MSYRSRVQLGFVWGSILSFLLAAHTALAQSDKSGDDFGDRTKSLGLTRFKPDSPHLRLAQMMQAVKNGTMKPQDFFRGMAKLKVMEGGEWIPVNMVTVNEVKTVLMEAGDATMAEVLGPRNPLGGTPVEAALLGYRYNLTMEAIRAAAADPRIRAYAKATESGRVFLSVIGTVKSFDALQFSNDIDFSFIGGNPPLLIYLRDFVNNYFLRETDLTMERIDSLGTAHGMGSEAVYTGKAGKHYGDSEIAKAKVGVVDLVNGKVVENTVEGKDALQETLLEQAIRKWQDAGGADELNETLERIEKTAKVEPFLSMEFARHLVRDIIQKSGSMTAMDCIAKGCKYLGRSNHFTSTETGRAPSDLALAEFAENLTKVKKTKGPADMASVIMDYFLATGMAASPFELNFAPDADGADRAVIMQNREKANAFLETCLKQIWANVAKGLEMKTANIRKKIKDQEEKKPSDVEAKAFNEEIGDLLTELRKELALFQNEPPIPEDVKRKWDDLVKLIETTSSQGIKLTPDQLRELEFIKKMLSGKHGKTTVDLARAALTHLADIAMTGNSKLDFIDDTLLGPMRGDPSFDQWVADLKEVKMMQADPKTVSDPEARRRLEDFQGKFSVKCRKYTYGVEQKLNQALYGNCLAKGVKKMNMTANEFIQSTRSGRAAMTGLTAFNLSQEFSAYSQALASGDFRELAAEIIRRRVPFGSTAEAAYQGRYLRASWDTFTTFFPPAALPEAAYGVAEYAATSAMGVLWSSELEAFINSLYAKAVFDEDKTKPKEAEPKIMLVSVTYGGKVFQREALEKGDEFILNPEIDTLLYANLAQNDPFLELMTDMQNHLSAGQKVADHFRLQYEDRWKAIKKAFIKETITQLEKRHNSEKAIELGKMPAMFSELMTITDELRIRERVLNSMDAQWNSSDPKALWIWIKNTRVVRTVWSGDLTETEKNKAGTVIADYLEAYRKILAARGRVEASVSSYMAEAGSDPGATQHGQRILTGLAFLSGNPEPDMGVAAYWESTAERRKNDTEQELLEIKSQSFPQSKLDTDFDRQMARKVFFESFWIEALAKMKVVAAAKVLTQIFTGGSVQQDLEERRAKRAAIIKDYERHYAVQVGAVKIQVYQLLDGKRTDVPIIAAVVSLHDSSEKEINVPHQVDGEYFMKGLNPGKYVVSVSSEGFKAADGKDTDTRILTIPNPTETTAQLLPMNFYLAPKNEAGEKELAVYLTTDPRSGTIRDSGKDYVALIQAVVVPKTNSGALTYQWTTGDGAILGQGEGQAQAVFIGAGKAGQEVTVSVFVTDSMNRDGTASCRIKVVSANAFEVKFADHRPEIIQNEGERLRLEAPVGEEWSYLWSIRDETGKLYSETDYGTQWIIDGRYFPGRKITVTVKAQNKQGDKAEGQTVVKVQDTESPAAGFSIQGPDTLEPGQTATFEAIGGVAPGTDPAKVPPVTWKLEEGAGKITQKGPATGSFVPQAAGKYVISATRAALPESTDKPQRTTHIVLVTPQQNLAWLDIEGPGSMFLGDAAQLKASYGMWGGPLPGKIRLEWSPSANGQGETVTFKPDKAGEHVVRCTAYVSRDGKETKGRESEKKIQVYDAKSFQIVIEPASVMPGQRFKARLLGGNTETTAVNWDIRGENYGIRLMDVQQTANGREGIFLFLGDSASFEKGSPRTLKIGCFVNPDTKMWSRATNIVSGPITVLAMPAVGDATGDNKNVWLHVIHKWVDPPDNPPVGYTDFGIISGCGEASGILPPINPEWIPMTVLGHTGWVFKACDVLGSYKGASGGRPFDDEEDIDYMFEGTHSAYGSFIGVKGKSILYIDVVFLGSSGLPRLSGGNEPIYAEDLKKVDRAFLAYLKGLPASLPDPVSLDQQGNPVVTIQPKPQLPWRKGELPTLTAVLTGAPEMTDKVSFKWEGSVTDTGSAVTPDASRPGSFKTTAIAITPTGEIARATFEWTISAVDLKIDRAGLKAAPLVGDKAVLAAVYEPLKEEGLWLKWDSDNGVVFEAADEMKQKVTATFAKPGKTKLWVTLYKQTGATHETLGEAEPIEVEVGKPQFELTAVPDKPYVDQVVTVTLADTPRLPDDLIRVNWASSDNVREAGPTADKRVYTFRPKDLKPITITATARCQENGEDLGEQPISVQAQSYALTVGEPALKGPPPMVYDPKAGKHVEVPRSLGIDQQATVTATIAPTPQKDGVRYRWACTPAEGRAVDAGRPEATISSHEPGTYTLTVTALDADGVELGTGQGAFTVVDNRETSKTPDKAKTDEAEKKYQEAQKLWNNGQLIPAIDSLKIGLTLDPKHEGCKRELERLTGDKERIETAVASGTANLGKMLLTAAETSAEDALQVNPQYMPAKQLKEYVQANKRARDEQTGIVLKEAEAARKACDFKKAVVRLDGLTGTYPELPPEAAQQVAALRADCVARQAEKERRNGLFFQANQAFGKLNDLGVEKILAEALDRADQYFGADDQGMVQTMQKLRMAAAERQAKRVQAEALWQEGETLRQQGRLEEAERKLADSLAAAPEKNEERIRVYDVLRVANEVWKDGLADAEQGDFEKGVPLCRESIKNARSEERVKKLAELELRWKKQQADTQWATALDLLKDTDLKGAIKFGERSLGTDPQPPQDRVALLASWKEADRLWEEARPLVTQKRYAEALSLVEASVKRVWTKPHADFIDTLKQRIADQKRQQEEQKKTATTFLPSKIDGTWKSFVRGNDGALCEILQDDVNLVLVIKRTPEVRAKGHFVDSTTFVVPEWNNLKGTVMESGRRINWGDSDWVRPGMQAPGNTGKDGSGQVVTKSSKGQVTEKPGNGGGATGKEPFKSVSSSNTVGSGSAKQKVEGSWPASVEGEWSFEANATYKGKLSFTSGANGMQGTIFFAGGTGPEPLTGISYDALSGKINFTRPSCIQIYTGTWKNGKFEGTYFGDYPWKAWRDGAANASTSTPVVVKTVPPVPVPPTPAPVSSTGLAGTWKMSTLAGGKMQAIGQVVLASGGTYTQVMSDPAEGVETQARGRWTLNGNTLTLQPQAGTVKTGNAPPHALEAEDMDSIRGTIDSRDGNAKFRLTCTDGEGNRLQLWFTR